MTALWTRGQLKGKIADLLLAGFFGMPYRRVFGSGNEFFLFLWRQKGQQERRHESHRRRQSQCEFFLLRPGTGEGGDSSLQHFETVSGGAWISGFSDRDDRPVCVAGIRSFGFQCDPGG